VETGSFVFQQGQGLLQVDDLQLSLILDVLILKRFVLAVADCPVQPRYLLPCLTDVLLQSGIIALDSLQLLVQS